MIDVLRWYVVVSLSGWLVLPLAKRCFHFLPDQGYTLSRPLALLGTGYLFWLLTYLGILQNNAGGVLLAAAILVILSLVAGRTSFKEIRDWIRQNKRLVITTEVLFLAAFLAWAFIRAANPDVNYTEKPMELAFLNAILRSPGFPPNDPWLSGYAISYYHFGYIIIAMLVHVTGTATPVAFNLAAAMWFALTAAASYGIVYNLLAKSKGFEEPGHTRPAASWALLAPLFILIVSNLSGFLDMLHALGAFWNAGADGQLHSTFWTWLNLRDINTAPLQPYSWMPQRGGWIWWMGSRVVQDFTLSGAPLEVIDEFPFFSYLLADLHPHVLGMPFVLLAAGLSLNLAYRGMVEKIEAVKPGAWLRSFDFWPAAVILGGLSFLNTWDFPIYVVLFAAVYTWLRTSQLGWSRARIGDFLKTGLMLGAAGGVLYLPFYIGFSSQAGGLLPSLAFQTRGVYFLIMFLPLLLPILIWLAGRVRGIAPQFRKTGILVSAGLGLTLFILMTAVGGLFLAARQIGQVWQQNGGSLASRGGQVVSAVTAFFNTQGGDGADLLMEALVRRAASPVTWLVLLIMVAMGWAILGSTSRRQAAVIEPVDDPGSPQGNPATVDAFVVLLILTGAGLTLLPEFFYLKDGFGTRLNTIFKFYFQAWILWGLAGAYTTAVLWRNSQRIGGWMIKAASSLMILAALIYPFLMIQAKTGLPDKPLSELTLDGKAYLQKYNPDEWAAFTWLQQAPPGVVAETVGIQYNPDTARVSTHTGQPTVLGWEGHEWQWRGGVEEIGSRRADLQTLYSTNSWDEARAVCLRYNIRYIYVGPVERVTYRVDESKFIGNSPIVFQNAAVTIYEVPGNNPLPLPVDLVNHP